VERAGGNVLLAAPTGRAARRLAEATGREARTLHRLLEYSPREDAFRRDEERPLEGEALVVDEASMLDLAMFTALLRAVRPGTRLVLVGDADQLPSVGAGNVLADLLASEAVPSVRLREIFRQASTSDIVTNAHRILGGHAPVPSADADRGDFFLVPADDPERARELIGRLVAERIPARFGLDPVGDVQVLAPMHRGACGAHALNTALQDLLNPGGEPLPGPRGFRVGDKVMQVKNDYDKDVFNGDVGRIVGRGAEAVRVRFDDRTVEYAPDELDALVPAYACSVHKSQGSEYPAVVMPLLTEHWVMLQRHLLYTAVTRGKRLVVLVGQERALRRAVGNDQGLHRYTALARRLREAAA
jgi:exodeoxyribonuclease V alpha subunit